MIEQRQRHRQAPDTHVQSVKAIAEFAKSYWRGPDWQAPDQLSSPALRHYLHHLLTARQRSWSAGNVVAAALRFCYVETLACTPRQLKLPPRPAQKPLPKVLSVAPLEHLFATTDPPQHRQLSPLT